MKIFLSRSIFGWFNSFSYLLKPPCFTTLVVKSKVLSIATVADHDNDHHRSSTNSETWNGLPDVPFKKILEKLPINAVLRMKLVSKTWNRILNRVDIPAPLEAPWLITSADTASDPKIFLTEIKVRPLPHLLNAGGNAHFFKLPKFHEAHHDVPAGGCLCGTSNGWLVIAAGPTNKPDMFLWNPLTGTNRKLPSLSTIPLLSKLTPKLEELPSFIKRVEIFSQEDCVVVVLFSLPTLDEKKECLAVCTPNETRWSVTEGNCYELYSDILYHDGKLYALAQINDNDDDEKNMKISNYTISMSSRSKYCEVEVCVLRLKYKLDAEKKTRYDEDQESIRRTFNITYANEYCEHLVECSITGKLMVVAAVFDLYEYRSNDDGPVESFRCHKTVKFEVRMIETLERVNNIGEQTLFISSTGSYSIPSSAEGAAPGYIFFSTDDARGLVGDQHQRVVVAREYGHFSIQQNVIGTNVEYLNFPVSSKFGCIKPKLF